MPNFESDALSHLVAATGTPLSGNGAAIQSRLFWLSPATRQSVLKKPGIAPPIGGFFISDVTAESAFRNKKARFYRFISTGHFRGHTADGLEDHRDVVTLARKQMAPFDLVDEAEARFIFM